MGSLVEKASAAYGQGQQTASPLRYRIDRYPANDGDTYLHAVLIVRGQEVELYAGYASNPQWQDVSDVLDTLGAQLDEVLFDAHQRIEEHEERERREEMDHQRAVYARGVL